ncbi:DUF4062 domain-containing protein [Marinifilum fragile]|uniref:DUF4062 domain-containing protein n=1 Tax=Marinifilum fragile TaxID=570161 RepID=UPI002AAB7DF7|nr:DUF4062 domain-containing protein [Marinifilum fragile]
MAKPRIFISSTFYDLRQVRADLDMFIGSLGYESVKNDDGDIPYGKDEALEEYCYKEIKNVDILISIIGGRFGTESKRSMSSISQIEVKTALKEGKQVYIFIEQNVLAEYETYLLNKDSEMKFRYVDDKRIYQFIEEIKGLKANNNIKGFETASDITKYLKEQFAGLFQRFLDEQTRLKEVSLIGNLEKTAETLNKLVNYLSDENKGQAEEINRILTINHPLVEKIGELLDIPYNFYIEGRKDLKALLAARGFTDDGGVFNDDLELTNYNRWSKVNKGLEYQIDISEDLFDNEGKLIFVKKSEWSGDYLKYNELAKSDDDDLPF